MFWPVFPTSSKHAKNTSEHGMNFGLYLDSNHSQSEKGEKQSWCFWNVEILFVTISQTIVTMLKVPNVVCILLKQLNVWEILFHPMFSPNSLAAINNCKIRLSLWKRQLLSQNPFKVNARKIFGKFNPLVSTFVSQHTILQRIESGRWGELSWAPEHFTGNICDLTIL